MLPKLVRGTLVKAAERLPELPAGMARALYAMFVVSEVHPFTDGNGRLSRLTMNAELSAAQQYRVIVPTLMRETYLDTLRVLRRDREPEPFVKAIVAMQRWTSTLDFNLDLRSFIQSVKNTHALERSMVDFKLLDAKPLAPSTPEIASPPPTERPRAERAS